MQCGAHIHVDADTVDCCAVMVQQHSYERRIVAMLGWELAKQEQNCTMLGKLLLCACWAIKRLLHYMLYLPTCTIVLPTVAETTCV